MNLGFDAISQFPISQVGKDDVVTLTVTGNNLVANIGNPDIAADAVQQNIDPNPLTLGVGTVTLVGTANLEASKNPLTLGTGTVTVTADANITASGNNLIIRSGSVTIVGNVVQEAPANAMTLRTGEVGVISWNEIVPGATMVWTPIKPYG
jgi:hypothetical protein